MRVLIQFSKLVKLIQSLHGETDANKIAWAITQAEKDGNLRLVRNDIIENKKRCPPND